MSHTVFISIGSNIGDRLENCKKAIKGLSDNENTRLIKMSSFYETEPWGEIEQDWFVNCVVKIETSLDVKALFALFQDIEKGLGRNREKKGGPRIIDLDILFFNRDITEIKEIIIPHQLLHKRRFVLTPASEIAPDFIHPVLKKRVADLLRELDDSKKVIRLNI